MLGRLTDRELATIRLLLKREIFSERAHRNSKRRIQDLDLIKRKISAEMLDRRAQHPGWDTVEGGTFVKHGDAKKQAEMLQLNVGEH